MLYIWTRVRAERYPNPTSTQLHSLFKEKEICKIVTAIVRNEHIMQFM